MTEGTGLPDGVVDLYVHALPDPIERSEDDVQVARRLQAAGFRAALHRHHFQSTAAQCRLARQVTGFDLYGAIVCNTGVGGVNPAAVEMALDAGARWVGLPTLSAAHHQRTVGHVPDAAQRGVDRAAGMEVMVDDSGALRDDVRTVIELADEHNVAVGLGYPSYAECLAVVSAGGRADLPFVLTNPAWTMRLTPDEVTDLLALGNCVLEITCYSLYRAAARDGDGRTFSGLARLARIAGSDRLVLSSDSGIASAPPAPELIDWAVRFLLRYGVAEQSVRRMVTSTPAALLGLG
jgi:hypothetical protein